MQVEIIKDLDTFLSLKDGWQDIEKANEEITYYSTFNYNYNWCRYCMESNNELFIIVVYNNKKVIGIAPFIIEKKSKFGVKYNVLKFMGKGDFFNFIIDKSYGNQMSIIKEIFKVIENNSEWDKITLMQISQYSKLAEFILRNDNYNKYFSPILECPCIYLDEFKDFNEYKKIFKIDKECKYYFNKMKKEVKFNFEVVNNKEVNLYEDLKKLHIKEQEFLNKEKNRVERKSLFEREKNDKFFNQIFNKNENNFTFLLRDEKNRIISYYNCYIFNKRVHFWNTGYNVDYMKYTPSKVVNYLLIEYLYENKINVNIFDFGAGRYPWKFKWTNKFNMIYKLEFTNLNTKKGRILNKILKLK